MGGKKEISRPSIEEGRKKACIEKREAVSSLKVKFTHPIVPSFSCCQQGREK